MPDSDAVLSALRSVDDPDLHRDIVALGFVKDVAITGRRVSFVLELTTPACPVRDQLREQAADAVRALPDVDDVDVRMTARVQSASQPETGQPPLPGVKNVVAVGAGKGGVGKSTVALNVALALARTGSHVGILDGDIYGPNIPMMLGLRDTQLETDGKKIVPAQALGLQVVSIGFLTDDDAPVVWRGPMLHGAVRQFFQDVAWADLDYLIVDMPPGTGDVALSLSQTVPVVGAVVVTTPQQVSLADSRRAVRMYQKLNIETLGIVENMSYYTCSNCHHETDIFGHGGGEGLAKDMEVPFLGRLPLYQAIREGGDSGRPLVVSEPGSPAGVSFMKVAERIAARVSIAAHRTAEANKGKIPLIQVR
jgi:ATP-binding protein involved in chromosome partitioning